LKDKLPISLDTKEQGKYMAGTKTWLRKCGTFVMDSLLLEKKSFEKGREILPAKGGMIWILGPGRAIITRIER